MDDKEFKGLVKQVAKDVEADLNGEPRPSEGKAETPGGEVRKAEGSEADFSGSAASKAQDDLNRD